MLRIHSTHALGSALVVALGLVASFGSLGACATSSKAFLDDEGGAFDEGGAGDEGGIGPEGGRVGDGGDGDGGDSGLGAPRIACGAAFCRSDETCVAGACNFACAGTHVPGDYATITSAVTAIAATGADATICLGAVQAGETVTISDPAAHMKKLTIIGTIPLQATLGSVSVGLGFSEITMIGFGTSSTMSVVGAPKVTLRALKLSTPSSYALSLRGSSTTVPTTILVDACEVSGTTASAYGIFVDNSLSAPLNVSIQNSYIHGGSYGVYSYGTGASLQLGILNNTIDKSVYGLYLSAAPTSQVGYVNNIISNSTQYGVFLAVGMTAVTHSNNALFGNTNNYSGAAVDGAGYVKTDCLLDVTSGVPEPKVGSPCRGTGKATGAPPSDFWNAPRGAAVDIGAVQPL